jgi:hypothetical protein
MCNLCTSVNLFQEAYGKSFDSRKVHVLLMLAASAADRDSLQRLLGIDLAIDKLNIGCDRFHGVLPLASCCCRFKCTAHKLLRWGGYVSTF